MIVQAILVGAAIYVLWAGTRRAPVLIARERPGTTGDLYPTNHRRNIHSELTTVSHSKAHDADEWVSVPHPEDAVDLAVRRPSQFVSVAGSIENGFKTAKEAAEGVTRALMEQANEHSVGNDATKEVEAPSDAAKLQGTVPVLGPGMDVPELHAESHMKESVASHVGQARGTDEYRRRKFNMDVMKAVVPTAPVGSDQYKRELAEYIERMGMQG